MSLINKDTIESNNEYNEFDSRGFETSENSPSGIEGALTNDIEAVPDEVVNISFGKIYDINKDTGIAASASINSKIEIKKKITKVNYNSLSNKKNLYLIIHYVGAESSAAANANYFYSVDRGASAHYFVDSKEIWQVVEDKDMAWHVGARSYRHPYCRNSNSIGIELCVKRDSSGKWYYEDGTIKNGITLAKMIVEKYSIPKSNVLRHYDVTGKICGEPHVRDEKSWNDFKNAIFEEEVKEDDEVLESMNLNINGKELTVDGILKDGTSYIPIRAFEKAGFIVDYDTETKLRTLKNKINKVKVKVDNGNVTEIDAINISNTNYVKIRGIAEPLNYSVYYNGNTDTIEMFEEPVNSKLVEGLIEIGI